MLKLNSISKSVFDAADIKDNQSVKVNSNGSTTSINRRDIIATGRLVACEYVGGYINANPMKTEKYNSQIEGKVTYKDLSQAHKEKKLLFCAAKCCEFDGSEAPATFEEFKKNAHLYATNKQFFKAMAAIDREILTPIFFTVIDSVGMGLMQWDSTPFGATKEIEVKSNDAFVFEDSSWGSGHSTSKNYLYAKTITLTPKMYSTNATLKWYQNIVNGDAGEYYAAIMNGMYSKIYALEMQGLKAAVGTVGGANNPYIPQGLTATTYTTQNWITVTDLVAAANGGRVSDLMAVGKRSALNNVVPVDGNGGAILGLQYGLGKDWFENGFLPNVAGVDLMPISPVIVPGTQNSSLDTIDTGNNIYILAKGLYKPMHGVYMEGSPIMLEATPGGNAGTADFTVDINVGAMFDIKPVFGSKVGVITSVYPTQG